MGGPSDSSKRAPDHHLWPHWALTSPPLGHALFIYRLPPLPPTSLDSKNGALETGLIEFHGFLSSFIAGVKCWKLDEFHFVDLLHISSKFTDVL